MIAAMADRLEKLQTLLAADPNDADVPYMIALEHGKAGDPAEAIVWLDKTLSLDPSYHYAFFQKAKMQSELGDDDDARQTLRDGIAQADRDKNAKAHGELQELLTALS